MLNIKNISLTKDGEYTRINISWDEFDDNGKTIRTNQRLSRVVTDTDALEHINAINDMAKTIIEEEG